MNNTELHKVLQKAKVPEPRPGFWDDLPQNVQRHIHRGETASTRSSIAERPAFIALLLRRAAVPLAFAAVCIMVGFIWGFNSHKSEAFNPAELAEARACWREVAALFPNQLQAIVFDPQGSRLLLSEHANPPGSAPIFLKLCDGKGCRRFVTFSGQQIKMNGESFEVLIDHSGEILLIGDAKVWTGSKNATFGTYKVFARPLVNS
jgi:hypothetical protein